MSVMSVLTCRPQECGRPVLDLHQHRAPHRADGRPVRGPSHRPGLCPALQRTGRLVCKPLQGLFTNDGGYQQLCNVTAFALAVTFIQHVSHL